MLGQRIVGDTLTLLLIHRVRQRNGRQQGPGVGVQRMGKQLIGTGHLHHLAEVHNADAVGEVLNDGQVVGDEEDGQAEFLPQLVQQVDNLGLNGHVQRGHGLVGNDQLRVHDDAAGYADPLPLAAGELVGIPGSVLRHQAHQLQHLIDLLGDDFVVPLALNDQALGDDLLDGHTGVQRGDGVLENHLDLGDQLGFLRLAYQQAVRTQLIVGIANVYYTLLMLDEQLAISQQTEESWKETVASTRALMDAGLANEAATSQMEAAYYSVQTSILDLKEQINQVENSLALLLAETPRRYERGKLADQQLPEDVAVGVPMQMLSNRPDVRAAERSLEQAFYVTNQARAAFYPSIVLSGSAGWTNSAGSMIVNPGKFLASAVGSLTQPLFNKGQIMAQYRIAKAQQEEASLSFQQALLNAGSEVNDALVACQTSKAKTVLFEKQIQSLEKALESTSLLMEHGTTTYLEVLTARQSLLSAQLSQTANRFTEIQSVINLYQALGGGRE